MFIADSRIKYTDLSPIHFWKQSATDGTKLDLNIGETRVWRLDESGQIYNPEMFGSPLDLKGEFLRLCVFFWRGGPQAVKKRLVNHVNFHPDIMHFAFMQWMGKKMWIGLIPTKAEIDCLICWLVQFISSAFQLTRDKNQRRTFLQSSNDMCVFCREKL